MTEEKKESKEISRRDFLRDTGLLVGGAAVGSTILLAACTSEPETETITQTATYPLSEGYLVVDSKKCCSCLSCMAVCSLVNEGVESLSLARIQVAQNAFSRFPEVAEQYPCRQCPDPLCVKACPNGACHIDTANGNVRVIDEEKCLGTNSCILCYDACPYIPHRIVINHEKNVSTKCDLCLSAKYWSEKGGPDGKQACVEVCPMKAIQFVKTRPNQRDEIGYNINLRAGTKWPLYKED